MKLKGAVSTTALLLIIGVIAFAGIVIYMNPGILNQQQQAATGPGPSGSGSGSQGFATNIRLGAVNAISGATANVNCELLDLGKKSVIAVTNVNGVTSMTTTGANDFNGYAICGNDNFANAWRAWTDQGDEFALTTIPISFQGRAGDVTFSSLPVYPQSVPLWTGIDDGTVEATTNITVGSGATVDTTDIRIAVTDASAAVGNPDFNGQGPLALCVNTTSAGLSAWNSVRPLSHDGTIPIPGVLSNRSVINGECYKLSTVALVDSNAAGTIQTYVFDLRMQARSGSNPGADQGATPEHVSLFLMDKCEVINDQNVWVTGYGFESNIRADQDCGIDSILGTNTKTVFPN